MSWSIYAEGTKKGVKRVVEKHTTDNDPDQYVPSKELILSEIGKIGDDKIIVLQASGSISRDIRNLNIRIESRIILPDPSEDEE